MPTWSWINDNLRDVLPPEEFLEEHMQPPANERPARIRAMTLNAKPSLKEARKTLRFQLDRWQTVDQSPDEGVVQAPFLKYGAALLDTHNTTAFDRWKSQVVFLNDKSDWEADIISINHITGYHQLRGGFHDASHPENQMRTQLCTMAQDLLMESGRCFVYILSIFAIEHARIFVFDRSGFAASERFNWLGDKTDILPRFFLRLFNLNGLDDTISQPDEQVVARLWTVLSHHPYYSQNLDEKVVKGNCLRLLASRRISGKGPDEQELVHCLTVGQRLFAYDGLFGRATRVYRVIIEEDLVNDALPAVYALKDAWCEGLERPEVDFYDLIEHHCETAEPKIDMDAIGMARCCGSIQLSDSTSPLFDASWNPQSHKTRLAEATADEYQRHHRRLLLTPVGSSIKSFASTKQLIQALLNVSLHLKIADDAGVAHRDISTGNVLFMEDTTGSNSSIGFLVDWDCAEFTPDGVEKFNQFVKPGSNRRPADETRVIGNLRSYVGTPAFMAVTKSHSQHYGAGTTHRLAHDLESLYWLLIWLILRYTDHKHPYQRHASDFFDEKEGKEHWLYDYRLLLASDISPLHQLFSDLAKAVARQAFAFESHYPELHNIDYEQWCAMLQDALGSDGWPADDASNPYRAAAQSRLEQLAAS
ncbi:Protein kinase domain-containing protein [Mycena indigotica]|uniref:Protein kinase domain-containing protein n=1 Tax=Mycena indigotica TaxID=2126181 RepID=A0A8H6SIE3_9AGAR|nr:Protein kinase domain-containing protein [Mycena indigotica]KAF7299340.1 Protein kinase domain-containing protein [Mycena indigotica]